tara:strand:+ start:736 stop:1431 length:696 start_codon:yes stop_codon:yes gene_type:complete
MPKDRSEIALMVQSRLASKRVPNKMVRPFAGSTLLDVLFSKLQKLTSLPRENIFLSAYDEPIKEIGRRHQINIFERSQESALEEKRLATIFEWHDKLPPQYKYVIMVSGCNPLLEVSTIDTFIESFIHSENEGAFAVTEKKTYYWDQNKNHLTDWKGRSWMDTKDVDAVYEAAHCLYGSRIDIIGEGYWMDTAAPPNLELVVINELESFDIDYEWQFRVGEALYKEFHATT